MRRAAAATAAALGGQGGSSRGSSGLGRLLLLLLLRPTSTRLGARSQPSVAARFIASSAASEEGTPEEQKHRASYAEAMRKLGAPPPAIPPVTAASGTGAGHAAAAAAAAPPPLSPEQVLAAAKLPNGEAICRDPTLGGSLPALLFLADVFWTGLAMEPPAKEEKDGAAAGGGENLVVAQDHAKAARLWAEASGPRFGDQGAKYNYAQCLLRGHGVPENTQQAEQLLTELVEDEESADAPRACYALAVLLAGKSKEQGGGQQGGSKGRRKGGQQAEELGREQERVYTLLLRAVKGGVLPAVHNLANLLAQGHGPRVPRDDAAAFALYQHGAALNDPWSTFTLGSWLCQGRGGEEEDWEQGFAMHRKAADVFGMPQASFNVGTHYFSGRGVEQDMAKAAKYFERAAEAGMTQAMVNLGNMYMEGLVSGGVEAAKGWYRRAAELGDPAGRECLARCEGLEGETKGEEKREGK